MTRSILAVPGLAATSEEFRAALYDMAERNGWDVDAIATVMSIESGFRASIQSPLQGQTASGLIQFTDATARGLGIPGGAAGVRAMSAIEQLPWVEKYYRRAFGSRTPRAVDFYLAGWGSGIGANDAHVLARLSDERKFNGGRDNLYTLNKGLDANGDGTITVGDIAAKMRTQQGRAGGRRLEVTAPPPLGPGSSLPPGGLASGPLSPESRSRSLEQLCALLPVVRLGSTGVHAALVEWFAGERVTARITPEGVEALRGYQRRLAELGRYDGRIDGEIGPKSWRAILEGVRT